MFLCEKMWFPVGSLIHKTTGASTFKIGMVLFNLSSLIALTADIAQGDYVVAVISSIIYVALIYFYASLHRRAEDHIDDKVMPREYERMIESRLFYNIWFVFVSMPIRILSLVFAFSGFSVMWAISSILWSASLSIVTMFWPKDKSRVKEFVVDKLKKEELEPAYVGVS